MRIEYRKPRIEGIHDHRTGGTAPYQETGRLPRGESWTVEAIPARDLADGGHQLDRGGIVQFRCTCHATGHEPWEAIVSVKFPASPWVY